jgi:hypothetical protein
MRKGGSPTLRKDQNAQQMREEGEEDRKQNDVQLMAQMVSRRRETQTPTT